jgi:hypothetical protein
MARSDKTFSGEFDWNFRSVNGRPFCHTLKTFQWEIVSDADRRDQVVKVSRSLFAMTAKICHLLA